MSLTGGTFGGFNGLSFVNNTTGFLSTQNGFIYKTTDSGDTWTYHDGIMSLTGGTFGGFNGLSFP